MKASKNLKRMSSTRRRMRKRRIAKTARMRKMIQMKTYELEPFLQNHNLTKPRAMNQNQNKTLLSASRAR
jgi:hypothetical protein